MVTNQWNRGGTSRFLVEYFEKLVLIEVDVNLATLRDRDNLGNIFKDEHTVISRKEHYFARKYQKQTRASLNLRLGSIEILSHS